MIANYHTHSRWCKHAQGEPEEYVEEAIRLGFKELAFTEHVPHRQGFCWLHYEELEEYNAAIDACIARYADRIHLVKGFECEYYPSELDDYRMLREKYGFSFLILGQHEAGPNREVNVFAPKTSDAMELYADSICAGLATGEFCMLAHPDVIMGNFIGGWDAKCEKAFHRIFACCEDHRIPVEINVNGMRGDRGYPDENALRISTQYRLEYLINTDAHNPAGLWDDKCEKAYALAERLGITVTPRLRPEQLLPRG